MSDMSEMIKEIEVGSIDPWALNPRKSFSEEKHNELVRSVKLHGVLQPLLVRPGEEDGRYQIVAGERRWRAAKDAKVSRVCCVVRELADQAALELALCENLEREDLDVMEEAEGYHGLISLGYGVKEMAARFGRERGYIYRRLELRKLGEPERLALVAGEISLNTAEVLAQVDEDSRAAALQRVLHPSHQQGSLIQKDAVSLIRRVYVEPQKAAKEWKAQMKRLARATPERLVLSYAESAGVLDFGSPYEQAERQPAVHQLTEAAAEDMDAVPSWGELAEKYGGQIVVAAPVDAGDEPLLLVLKAPLVEADIARAAAGESLFPKPLSEKAAKEERLLEIRRREELADLRRRRCVERAALLVALREGDLDPLLKVFVGELAEANECFQDMYNSIHNKDMDVWNDDEVKVVSEWVDAVLKDDGLKGVLWLLFGSEFLRSVEPGVWIEKSGVDAACFPLLAGEKGSAGAE